MSSLHTLHLVLLAMWGGLVLAEMVVEWASRREAGLKGAAVRLHYWIDLVLEAPVLAGVVVTGGILLTRVPWDLALGIKVACALVAVGANVWCMGVVLRRARTGDLALGNKVFLSALIGVPFGVVALVMGLTRVGG